MPKSGHTNIPNITDLPACPHDPTTAADAFRDPSHLTPMDRYKLETLHLEGLLGQEAYEKTKIVVSQFLEDLGKHNYAEIRLSNPDRIHSYGYYSTPPREAWHTDASHRHTYIDAFGYNTDYIKNPEDPDFEYSYKGYRSVNDLLSEIIQSIFSRSLEEVINDKTDTKISRIVDRLDSLWLSSNTREFRFYDNLTIAILENSTGAIGSVFNRFCWIYLHSKYEKAYEKIDFFEFARKDIPFKPSGDLGMNLFSTIFAMHNMEDWSFDGFKSRFKYYIGQNLKDFETLFDVFIDMFFPNIKDGSGNVNEAKWSKIVLELKKLILDSTKFNDKLVDAITKVHSATSKYAQEEIVLEIRNQLEGKISDTKLSKHISKFLKFINANKELLLRVNLDLESQYENIINAGFDLEISSNIFIHENALLWAFVKLNRENLIDHIDPTLIDTDGLSAQEHVNILKSWINGSEIDRDTQGNLDRGIINQFIRIAETNSESRKLAEEYRKNGYSILSANARLHIRNLNPENSKLTYATQNGVRLSPSKTKNKGETPQLDYPVSIPTNLFITQRVGCPFLQLMTILDLYEMQIIWFNQFIEREESTKLSGNDPYIEG